MFIIGNKVKCVTDWYNEFLSPNQSYKIIEIEKIGNKIYLKFEGEAYKYNSDKFKLSNNEIRKQKLNKINGI